MVFFRSLVGYIIITHVGPNYYVPNDNNRSYNVSVRPFYEKAVLFRVIGFKPDLNESIAMMEKSNKRKLIATLDSMYPCILHQHDITIF